MKNLLLILAAALLLAAHDSALARDDRQMHSIQQALDTADAKARLNEGIRFYFASTPGGDIARRHGEFVSNKKTNAFNKSDSAACQWAFLSAMLALQDRARREGGNAVVNIRSYYKRNEVSSPTEFECGAGAMVAGVTLKGEVVTLN